MKPAGRYSNLNAPRRKHVGPHELLPIELDGVDRQLILDHTFAEDELTGRLRLQPASGQPPIYRFTLSDFDHLAGHVGAAANHAPNMKLRKQLDALFDRIDTILESHTDGE